MTFVPNVCILFKWLNFQWKCNRTFHTVCLFLQATWNYFGGRSKVLIIIIRKLLIFFSKNLNPKGENRQRSYLISIEIHSKQTCSTLIIYLFFLNLLKWRAQMCNQSLFAVIRLKIGIISSWLNCIINCKI